HRFQATGIAGHQAPVDQPEAWRWVGQRSHDQQLLGIGHYDPLEGVGVIGRAAQHAGPLLDPDDPGEPVRFAADVADQPDPVTHHHRGAPELTGPHRGYPRRGVAVGGTGPPAAIHCDDHRGARVRVLRTALGAGPGTSAPGPDSNVGLVETVRAPGGATRPVQPSPPASIAAQLAGNSGSVLAVAAMSSTAIPGTTRPRIAPAVAIRWSA